MKGAIPRWLAGESLADSICGDLEEERRRRSARSPVAARFWFWRAWLGVLASVAMRRVRDAGLALASGAWWRGSPREWRQAVRGLRRTPWYAIAGMSVIALSLSLSTTVFAIVDGVLFKPLPYPKPDQLVVIAGGFRALPSMGLHGGTWPDLRAWRAAAPTTSFAAMTMGGVQPISDVDQLREASVDAVFLETLGVRPLIGGLSPADFVTATTIEPSLLAYGTWQGRFGGDPNVLGRVLVNSSGQGIRIVGVLPDTFVFPTSFADGAPEILMALRQGRSANDPTSRFVWVIARRPDGLSNDALARRLTETTPIVAAMFPPLPDDPRISPTRRITRGPFDVVFVRPLKDDLTTRTHAVSAALFAIGAGLLLLASLNLIGLSAARFAERRPELTLRRALGSSHWGLVRLLAIEQAAVVILGGLIGLVIAPWTVALVAHLLPTGMVFFKAFSVDWRVVAFGIMAIGASVILVSVGTGLLLPRRSLRPAGGTTEPSRGGIRRWLIGAEVALAFTMTVAGAFLSTSLIRVWQEPVGYAVEHAARVRIDMPRADVAGIDWLLEDVRRVPGVAFVAAADIPILEHSIYGSAFESPLGARRTGDVQALGVTGEFFGATGLTAVEGRLPTLEECAAGRSVIAVSQVLAVAYWPARSALGQTLRRPRDGRVFTVVGVVPDVRTVQLDLDPEGEIYSPLAAASKPGIANVLIRFRPESGDPLGDVLQVFAAHPELRVRHAETLASALGTSVDWRRFQAWLSIALGLAALSIVGVGLLGLMAMRASRRTREVGIRMALGSTSRGIRVLLMAEEMAPVACGLGVGLACAAAVARSLRAYLYKPPAYDWPAWSAAVVLLTLAAGIGVAIPAWRASRVDPVRALRVE